MCLKPRTQNSKRLSELDYAFINFKRLVVPIYKKVKRKFIKPKPAPRQTRRTKVVKLVINLSNGSYLHAEQRGNSLKYNRDSAFADFKKWYHTSDKEYFNLSNHKETFLINRRNISYYKVEEFNRGSS